MITKLEIFFMVVWLIIFIAIGFGIYKLVIVYKRTKQAITYANENSSFCGTPTCPPVLKDLAIPTISGKSYSKDLALYCADLIGRVLYFADHHQEVKMAEGHSLIQMLKTISDDKIPVVGWITRTPDGVVWVTFRGTRRITEWMYDFNYSQELLEDDQKNTQVEATFLQTTAGVPPRVHSGFMKMYNNFRELMLNSIPADTQTVVVSGHSLGGSLAQMAGLDIAKTGREVKVYTFASPRVGDEAYCENFSALDNLVLYKIINTCDIAQSFPPAVVPHYSNPEDPLYYQDCGNSAYFTLNTKSIGNNHTLYCYTEALNKDMVVLLK